MDWDRPIITSLHGDNEMAKKPSKAKKPVKKSQAKPAKKKK
jgi:hypothetical protein